MLGNEDCYGIANCQVQFLLSPGDGLVYAALCGVLDPEPCELKLATPASDVRGAAHAGEGHVGMGKERGWRRGWPLSRDCAAYVVGDSIEDRVLLMGESGV